LISPAAMSAARHFLYRRAFRSRAHGQVPGVQRHVPLLDSDGAERPQRRHVLREAYRRHDSCELLRPWVSIIRSRTG